MAGRTKRTDKDETNTQSRGGEAENTKVVFARAMIEAVLQEMKKKFGKAEFKPTLSEFIRLVQLDRELAEDEPLKEIKVSWCEPKKGSGPEP